MEKVDSLHIVRIMHKLLTSHLHTSELMNEFEKSVAIRRQELTNNNTEKRTFFVKLKLSDLFGFADQEKITFCLGYTSNVTIPTLLQKLL